MEAVQKKHIHRVQVYVPRQFRPSFGARLQVPTSTAIMGVPVVVCGVLKGE